MALRLPRVVNSALLAGVLLAGCGPAATPANLQPSSTQTHESGLQAPDITGGLFGQWLVVSVAGREGQLDWGGKWPGQFLIFGDDWWHFQSQCVWSHGDYQVEGGSLRFEPVERRYDGVVPEAPLMAMCARGLLESERNLPQIMSNGATFTIEDDSLTIRSPRGDIFAERNAGGATDPGGKPPSIPLRHGGSGK